MNSPLALPLLPTYRHCGSIPVTTHGDKEFLVFCPNSDCDFTPIGFRAASLEEASAEWEAHHAPWKPAERQAR